MVHVNFCCSGPQLPKKIPDFYSKRAGETQGITVSATVSNIRFKDDVEDEFGELSMSLEEQMKK